VPQLVSQVMINASLDHVWEIAKDVESFPEFMPDLKSLVVVERSEDGSRTITDWVGIVRDFKMTVKWTEEDIWNLADYTCTFKIIKGDLNRYDGCWKFTQTDCGVQFDSVINWEYDVPLIGALIKNIVGAKLKENADNILKAIKARAEAG